MKKAEFSPGFRMSSLDAFVLLAGLILGFFVSKIELNLGIAVILVVFQFFLFCNVFRISRGPELLWATGFVVLAGLSLTVKFPPWPITFMISSLLGAFLIFRETRRPNYHGVCWRRWNPDLPNWWKQNSSL